MFAAPSGPIGGTVENRADDAALACRTSAHGRRCNRRGNATRLGATRADGGARRCRTAAATRAHRSARWRRSASTRRRLGRAPKLASKLGEFSWHELATNVDPSEAFKFYSGCSRGMRSAQYDMGPMGQYLIFGRDGQQLGGMFDKGSAGKPGSAYWLGYVSVTDLDATVERARPRAARCWRDRWTCRAATASPSSWIRTARSSRCT